MVQMGTARLQMGTEMRHRILCKDSRVWRRQDRGSSELGVCCRRV